MFCANCGKKIDDNVKFCTNCGTAVEVPVKAQPVQPPVRPVESFNTVPVQAPVYAPAPASKPKMKKKKKRNPVMVILPIVVVAIVLVAILAVCLISAIGGAEMKVGKAFGKSIQEYVKVSEKLELSKVDNKAEMAPFSETVELKLNDLPSMPELEGLGARVYLGMDMEARELGFAVTPIYGSMDIVDAQILLKDSELYASVPQLTGGRSYMVNTETIGMDLVNLGADAEAKDLGFNVFELTEIIKEATKLDEDATKMMEDASKDLIKAIEAEKIGKETLEVNDHNLKCVVYDVVIPEDALKDYFRVMEDVSRDMDTEDLIADVMEAMGFPNYVIDELLAETTGTVDMGAAYDEIDTLLDELGDIELQVGIYKGLIASVYWECSIMDTDMEVSLQLGGGKEYVNDLRLEFVVDNNGEIILTSTGDHACSKGVFTDETTIEFNTDYEEITMTSELSYEPKGKDENFQWTFKSMDVAKISVAGQITLDKNNILMQLDDVDIWAYGEHVLGLSLNVQYGEYQALDMDTGDAVEILAMSEDEMYEELMLMEESATVWAEDLMASNPDLVALLQSMMYY